VTPGEWIAAAGLVGAQAAVVVGYLIRLEARLARIEHELGTGKRTRVVDFRDRRQA
jgi:hypothetical protein